MFCCALKALPPKLAVIAAFALVTALPTSAAGANRGPGPGCDAERTAVAHYANGVILARQPARAPVPCMTFTGPTTDSAAVGITNAGTLFYAPIEYAPGTAPAPAKILLPTVLARSRDRGATWQRNVPSPLGDVPVASHGGLTDWLSVDPETSRVWYATPTLPCGATISWSDDAGATWEQIPNSGCPAQGANALIEGPAPAGGAEPSGYPHVVYYCANAGEVPLDDQSYLACRRSLDGGRSFQPIESSPDSVPPSSDCGSVVRETRVGTVGHDGVLYFPQNVCARGDELRLAISSDEGATWRYAPVAKAEIQDLYPPAIAADAGDNLFLAWKGAGGLPYLTVSRDRGAGWTEPIAVAAPGVSQIRRLALTARGTGHIAVSYLGTTDGGQSFNAYITESRDALAAEPVFWSAPVNDPATPVALGSERGTFGDRIQFLSGMIGPDGTPWAAFHCARTSLCPDARVGIVGRLAKSSTRRGSG